MVRRCKFLYPPIDRRRPPHPRSPHARPFSHLRLPRRSHHRNLRAVLSPSPRPLLAHHLRRRLLLYAPLLLVARSQMFRTLIDLWPLTVNCLLFRLLPPYDASFRKYRNISPASASSRRHLLPHRPLPRPHAMWSRMRTVHPKPPIDLWCLQLPLAVVERPWPQPQLRPRFRSHTHINVLLVVERLLPQPRLRLQYGSHT